MNYPVLRQVYPNNPINPHHLKILHGLNVQINVKLVIKNEEKRIM